MGGAVASWLTLSTPERAARVRALGRDIVLCSWAKHFSLTVPLSTQGGVEILPVASCYRNRDKLRPEEPRGLCADFLAYWIKIIRTCT